MVDQERVCIQGQTDGFTPLHLLEDEPDDERLLYALDWLERLGVPKTKGRQLVPGQSWLQLTEAARAELAMMRHEIKNTYPVGCDAMDKRAGLLARCSDLGELLSQLDHELLEAERLLHERQEPVPIPMNVDDILSKFRVISNIATDGELTMQKVKGG